MEDDSDNDEFSVQPYMYEPEFSDNKSDFIILTQTARKSLPMLKTTNVLGIRISKYIVLFHARVGKITTTKKRVLGLLFYSTSLLNMTSLYGLIIIN